MDTTTKGDSVREVVFEFDSKVVGRTVGVEEEEGIPQEDLIRVLYLAASTGDFEEVRTTCSHKLTFVILKIHQYLLLLLLTLLLLLLLHHYYYYYYHYYYYCIFY